MFPPSLQKNIQELDRQISLLETECENMEAENREAGPKTNSKHFREPSSAPSTGRPPKMVSLTPTRLYPLHKGANDLGRALGEVHSPESAIESKCPERRDSSEGSEEGGEARKEQSGERKEVFEVQKPCRHSMVPVKEMTESSDDSYPVRMELNKAKALNVSAETSKDPQMWCELAKEQLLQDRRQERKPNKKNLDKMETFLGRNPAEPRFSSDEEFGKSRRFVGAESKSQSVNWPREVERPVTPTCRSSNRRPRSARTRKKSEETVLDVKKGIHEKEVQCIMWNEEKEKTEFLLNLSESIRILHLFIEEVKTKPTQEKRNELLNDVQNTLMKIGGMNSIDTLQSSLNVLMPSKENNSKPSEGEESIEGLKKALIAVKKLCQELSHEKLTLSEELNKKNTTISCLKTKEKEYLSLISNLKFNLERLKEEVEEGQLAKRDLLMMKTKLREEAKVIEALKKSHGKMQALIEHYVLENDKLRSEVRMGKLESQKYHVLLSGKEAEINKRKQEIELFQKQITQQLRLLRLKATENEVENAIETIESNTLQTEVNPPPFEKTFEKGETSAGFDQPETAPSKRTQTNAEKRSLKATANVAGAKAEPTKLPGSSQEPQKPEEGLTSCRSEESIPEVKVRNNRFNVRAHGALSSSKILRTSINEMLEEIRRESSDKFCPSLPNSSNTSRCSMLSSYSWNASECTQKD